MTQHDKIYMTEQVGIYLFVRMADDVIIVVVYGARYVDVIGKAAERKPTG